MKKLYLFILLLALPQLVSAYDCQVDGIYYNLIPKGNVAEVTFKDNSYNSYSGSVTIPEKFTYADVEYFVTSIGDFAFFNCSGLTSLTIPNSVTSLGEEAFTGCSGLTSFTIPNSVTSIGRNTFSDCRGLTSVTIPNSVTIIGGYAFQNCTGLTSVNIGNSVTIIGDAAFIKCSSLTSVTLGNSVTCIEAYAFDGCSGLTSITIPNSVTSIGYAAFRSCKGLTSIIIPNSLTNIEQVVFAGCTGLTSVTIPNSVTSIGKGAFSGCTGLTSLTIPNSVTSIGRNTFYGCTGLTSVTIGYSVTSIGGSAFQGCTSLTSLTIPNSVTSIGGNAFQGCTSLTSVSIGSSMRNIYDNAFAECSKLEEVHCLAEKVPSTSSNTFEKSYPEYMTLYVPASSLNAYKTTEPWSLFGTIKAISGSGEEPEEPTKCATPSISYDNKKLTFSCATEGVEFVSKITDVDITDFYSSSIDLAATYEISVYATKSGYTNSDVATATLVWTEGIFTETTPSTPSSAKAVAESIPVLISAQNGTITVRGEQNGLPLTVYTADGKMLGSTTMKDGQASISTNLQRGEIAIVKVGSKSVKIKM